MQEHATGKPESMYSVAQRLIGIHELPGPASEPFISWCLKLVGQPQSDEVLHCSAFIYGLTYLLGLPRPLELPGLARAWLTVGEEIALEDARPGFDVVIFKRGLGEQPPASVIQAPGHVALFSSQELTIGTAADPGTRRVRVLGANQGIRGEVSLATFPAALVLGVRRLWSVQ